MSHKTIKPPGLSEDDLAFLRDKETWRGGPGFDLTMVYPDADCAEPAREALFSLPNILGPFSDVSQIPAPSGHQLGDDLLAWSAAHVVFDPQRQLRPFGLGSSFLKADPDYDDEIDYLTVGVGPQHIERVCGIDPWDFEPSLAAPSVIALHRILVDIARHVYRRCPFQEAAIEREACCPGFDKGIVVYREVADAAGCRVRKYTRLGAVLPFE